MSKKLFFTGMFLSSLLGGLVVYLLINSVSTGINSGRKYVSFSDRQEMMRTSNNPEVIIPEGLNFLSAANGVLPGVVHIQSFYGGGASSDAIDRLMGRESASSGSGVIISDDGYISTNYHVIEDASRIEVTLNDNRIYDAEIIGIDRTTDLALIKIEERDLPYVSFGDSDVVLPGEWVLAIGNPFNLNSTVTAGIVSAKTRSIDVITRSNLRIESFIQTDAAVNPGNSGGALVNLNGELIGINTAIATRSGKFEGYSFAIPVTLVEKVMNDLLEFGEVKRGLLGITIFDMDARLAEINDLKVVSGVFVRDVTDNGAGREAGIKPGDVIIGIGNRSVSNTSELQELVARNRPGDVIEVTFVRENEEFKVSATLRDYEGNIEVYSGYLNWNKVYFQDVEFSAESTLQMGVRVQRNNNNNWKEAGVQPGFVITHINDIMVNSSSELIEQLESAGSDITLRGIDEYGHNQIIQID